MVIDSRGSIHVASIRKTHIIMEEISDALSMLLVPSFLCHILAKLVIALLQWYSNEPNCQMVFDRGDHISSPYRDLLCPPAHDIHPGGYRTIIFPRCIDCLSRDKPGRQLGSGKGNKIIQPWKEDPSLDLGMYHLQRCDVKFVR